MTKAADLALGKIAAVKTALIEFTDGGDLGATAYVQLTPNDAEKTVHIRKSLSGSRSIIIFQGTYNTSRDFEIGNGKDVFLKFSGGGSTATVTDVYASLAVTKKRGSASTPNWLNWTLRSFY